MHGLTRAPTTATLMQAVLENYRVASRQSRETTDHAQSWAKKEVIAKPRGSHSKTVSRNCQGASVTNLFAGGGVGLRELRALLIERRSAHHAWHCSCTMDAAVTHPVADRRPHRPLTTIVDGRTANALSLICQQLVVLAALLALRVVYY